MTEYSTSLILLLNEYILLFLRGIYLDIYYSLLSMITPAKFHAFKISGASFELFRKTSI